MDRNLSRRQSTTSLPKPKDSSTHTTPNFSVRTHQNLTTTSPILTQIVLRNPLSLLYSRPLRPSRIRLAASQQQVSTSSKLTRSWSWQCSKNWLLSLPLVPLATHSRPSGLSSKEIMKSSIKGTRLASSLRLGRSTPHRSISSAWSCWGVSSSACRRRYGRWACSKL